MQINAGPIRRLTKFWVAADLERIEQRRGRRVLLLSSLLVLLIGLGWCLFFAWRGDWVLVALSLVLALAALALNWQQQGPGVPIMLILTLMGALTLISLVYDVPTTNLRRATHFHLLPLSVMALMAFRGDRPLLRHGMAFICLLAFMLLEVDPGISSFGYGLPDDVRRISAWAHPITALLNMYVLIYFMQADSSGYSRLEDELRLALERSEFDLHYQPQIDSEGRVVAAEALLRWQHPRRGLVAPGNFIALAEETGMILPIGHWVLEMACAQLQVWGNYNATRHLSLAINISQVQFRQSDFVNQVLTMIDRYDFDVSLLELELTESLLVDNMEDIFEKMSTLRQRGVKFSLDDFGTGFSSLSYLKRLPFNKLKVDQSFVRDALTNPHDAAIVHMVVELGRSMDLLVVAEGVETEGQREFLKEQGCHLYQGYLYSPALPIGVFNTFLLKQNALSKTLKA